MKESAKKYNRIVIKIGSSLFCSEKDGFDSNVFSEVSSQVAELIKSGKEVIVVSSGAIAMGMNALGIRKRPTDLNELQAAAAIGQNEVIDRYRTIFKDINIPVAQILLTWDDFSERKRYLNIKNTLLTLFKHKSLPVINENDTVSTEEIRFGDNDTLSARVASLISADLLIILSDVDGLLDKEKRIVPLVDEITPQIKALACPTGKQTCVGGMITKIDAAKIAVDSGISCVIANGRKSGIIHSVVKEPGKSGTLFVNKNKISERERWIAFGTKTKGVIRIDDGAVMAIKSNKSLLSVGVVSCDGDFPGGAIVSITDKDNKEIARGKTRISCRQLEKVKGERFKEEVLHCDNIVVFGY